MKIRLANPWSWYPVVAAVDLRPGAVMPALLHGERLVVWRSQEGRVGVWNDRCPHRSMSLSFGATIGETLVCPYHGWEFRADGHCSRIPAHPDLAPSRAARARVYPALEAHGYVWACLGEPAAATPAYPTLDGLSLHPVRSLHLGIDAGQAATILLSQPLLRDTETTAAAPSDEADALSVAHRDAHGRTVFRTRLEFPSLVVGSHDTVSYVALIQPTGAASSAVHLASTGEPGDALALNAALVRLRRGLPPMQT